MKVMIVNSLYYPFKIGGAEVSVQLLAEGLAKYGFTVMVVTLTDDINKHLTSEYINNVKVTRVYLKNIYWPFSSEEKNKGKIQKMLWHLIDSYNPFMRNVINELVGDFSPDIIHTNNICGFSTAIWKNYGNAKIIHTIRDYYLLTPSSVLVNDEKLSIIERIFSILKRQKISRVSYFIGISEYILKTHQRLSFLSDKERVLKIYNCARLNDFFYINKNKKNPITIGFIGRLTEEKGYSLFYEIAEHYKLEPRIIFKAAGNGNANYLSELKEKYPDVNLTEIGHVPQDEFYKSIDLLIIPAKWAEPFGRTAIEAFSYGVPVISSGAGGLREVNSILNQSMYTCFEDLIQKIDCVINGDLSVDKSLNYVFNDNFSEEQYISEHIKLYSLLCNR
ncbi:TPA: glycosyltransferase [Raoultella planticola]